MLRQFAVDQNLPISGKDFKTGQTLIKTVLAPMLRTVIALRVVPVLLGLGLAAAALAVFTGAPPALAGSERLPDLDQVTPADLVITLTRANGRASGQVPRAGAMRG